MILGDDISTEAKAGSHGSTRMRLRILKHWLNVIVSSGKVAFGLASIASKLVMDFGLWPPNTT